MRDRGDKRTLRAMRQGDGGVAMVSANAPGKPELMSAAGGQGRHDDGKRPCIGQGLFTLQRNGEY
jgi:hypothetical protein